MKKYRSFYVTVMDLWIVFISYVIALWIRFDFSASKIVEQTGFFNGLALILFIYFIGNKLAGLDKSIWARISVDEAMRVININIINMLVVSLFKFFTYLQGVPRSVIVIAFLLITLAQETVRFSYRMIRLQIYKRKKNKDPMSKRILIYGAGQAGTIIARESLYNDDFEGQVVGFVDDNPLLKGKTIVSMSVFGTGDNIQAIVHQQSIDEIIIAMPSTNIKIQKDIMQKAFETGIPVKSVNSAANLINGDPLKHALKKVDIVDLLQRKEIIIDSDEIKESITRKDVLVTGAAGSIGSELVRQIINYEPNSITLLDFNENGLYELQQDLLMLQRENVISKEVRLYTYLASIRDIIALDNIFEIHKFNLVFHAAAHKHVPLMETSPEEAIKNNIFGTKNLIETSKKYKVDKFINVSTDKAVNPTNVMGATKRFIEMMLQSQPDTSHTKFVAVRFGNVLGSNGSVVPLFKKQIEAGGPVTVTHKDITRYFMTIPEAVSLILQAETFAKGGEIFVLDMGEPVKIKDLAEKVIKLSGYRPYKDIDIKFTGLRPGEKLYEELLMSEEGLKKTPNELIFIATPIKIHEEEISEKLNKLNSILKSGDVDVITDVLKEVVPTYRTVEA